jgi:hypothetical protein
MSDAAIITAKLKGIRRRQLLILMLQGSSLAFLGFIFLIILNTFKIFSLPGLSVRMHVISGAILIVAVLVVSLLKMPSWKDTAKRVDVALGLQQRVETSWECIPPRDEIEVLLIGDTSRRIRSMIPAAVMPIKFGRRTCLLFLIFLIATTTLGIVRILEGWNHRSLLKVGDASLPIAGSSAHSRSEQKANQAKRQAKTAEILSSAVSQISNPEFNRLSSQADPRRKPENIPGRVRMQSSQAVPVAIPDRGASERQEQFARGTTTSGREMNPEYEKSAQSRQSQNVKSAAADGTQLRAKTAAEDLSFRSSAGAASIRKSERERGDGASVPTLFGKERKSGMLSGGQTSQSSNQKNGIFPHVVRPGAYSRENPALGSAVEQALQKEKIPPGFKKYIADYFRAIHP